ncbi:hypothetical protein B0J12DRAFT_691342 [Macrophomina phaseolina]|uniref:Secreted protein n=1 Tax=Macrophomina phaseolina TaxID=35725 RepID=A0ABQ8FR74_9PEZI|nr:hypothetical protein B0J12DRAFT_691342 [Macrophomina phaseolina]
MPLLGTTTSSPSEPLLPAVASMMTTFALCARTSAATTTCAPCDQTDIATTTSAQSVPSVAVTAPPVATASETARTAIANTKRRKSAIQGMAGTSGTRTGTNLGKNPRRAPAVAASSPRSSMSLRARELGTFPPVAQAPTIFQWLVPPCPSMPTNTDLQALPKHPTVLSAWMHT